tara:strand:+ start:2931 stop:3470 length:540 start_codon:yes stop_codon:yes gene_type:complete
MKTKEEQSAYRKVYRDAHKVKQSAYVAHRYQTQKEGYTEANKIINAERMTVNGKYVSRKHPLWKIGNYRSFNDAAFSSFVNYNKTPEGDVYLITNDAWPEWIKVGKAGDAEDRLKNYQTSDPFRAYKLEHSITIENRHTGEVKAHKALEALSEDRKNEWFKVDLTIAVRCIEALNEHKE